MAQCQVKLWLTQGRPLLLVLDFVYLTLVPSSFAFFVVLLFCFDSLQDRISFPSAHANLVLLFGRSLDVQWLSLIREQRRVPCLYFSLHVESIAVEISAACKRSDTDECHWSMCWEINIFWPMRQYTIFLEGLVVLLRSIRKLSKPYIILKSGSIMPFISAFNLLKKLIDCNWFDLHCIRCLVGDLFSEAREVGSSWSSWGFSWLLTCLYIILHQLPVILFYPELYSCLKFILLFFHFFFLKQISLTILVVLCLSWYCFSF